MDNRAIMVPLRPFGKPAKKPVLRRNIYMGSLPPKKKGIAGGNVGNGVTTIVKKDAVTSALGHYGDRGLGLKLMDAADHFKWSDIGKGIAKGVTKVVTKDKAKEAQKLAKIDEKYTKLENSKIGKIGNKVAGAVLGAAVAVTGGKLLSNALKNKSTSQVAAPPKGTVDASRMAGTKVKAPTVVKSMTPQISPLPPSVPSTPGDANIEAAIQESERSGGWLGDAITNAAEQIPSGLRAELQAKGREIAESGKKGILTKAQKELEKLGVSGELLPKTKAIKDAERLLLTPQHAAGDVSQAATRAWDKMSELTGMSPSAMIGIALGIAGIILTIYFARK